MEGVTRVQPGAANSVGAALGDDLFQVLDRTRQHGVRAVVGGDRHLREFVRDIFHVLGVSEHRHHPTALWQVAEQPPAFGE